MKPTFIYDDEAMRAGLMATQKIAPQVLKEAHKSVERLHAEKHQGWLDILDDKGHLAVIAQLAEKFSRFEHCLVLGIGGSDLGARAILQAIGQKPRKTKLWFAGDTTDPEEISAILDDVPWNKVCLNVVSKSGGTLEPMTVFFEALRRLEKRVGVRQAAKRVICTTDPEGGALHDWALAKGYAMLPVPQNIGGRFSVLTSVGLFPLALAGIDIRRLLQGAKAMRDEWSETGGPAHAADRFAAWQVAHDSHQKRNLHVLFTYSSRLDGLAHWWRQLWAESLGKSQKRDGKPNAFGPTPVTALGPKDQHSQLQLYQDGPDDKIYTFISVERGRSGLRVPLSIRRFQPLAHAAGLTFLRLLDAEEQGTEQTLIARRRPVGEIRLGKIDESSLGSLIVFFELATAMAGELYDVDAYDQPGVEASKHRAKELLTA